MRADPVFSAPGRVLGFVFLFTDLSERKAAEAARRRFQESVIERNRGHMRHDDPNVAMLYRQLMSSVVENAQLAALEITDGLDMVRMAELLESVRGSVTRAAEVLEHLIQQSRRAAGRAGRRRRSDVDNRRLPGAPHGAAPGHRGGARAAAPPARLRRPAGRHDRARRLRRPAAPPVRLPPRRRGERWRGAPSLRPFGIDLAARRRSALLLDDLAFLGAPAAPLPAPPVLPALRSAAQALGCLYVTEGSTLGGRELARRLDHLLPPGSDAGRRFLLGHGARHGAHVARVLRRPGAVRRHAGAARGDDRRGAGRVRRLRRLVRRFIGSSGRDRNGCLNQSAPEPAVADTVRPTWTQQRLLDELTALGIAYERRTHPAVLTVEAARAHWAELAGLAVKNLLLKDAGGRLWLVVAPAEQPVDLKSLPGRIGSKRLSFAGPADLAATLAVERGSVTPLAVVNDREGRVSVVLERRWRATPRIKVHPLVNTATMALAGSDLVRFLVRNGHAPFVAALPLHPASGLFPWNRIVIGNRARAERLLGVPPGPCESTSGPSRRPVAGLPRQTPDIHRLWPNRRKTRTPGSLNWKP